MSIFLLSLTRRVALLGVVGHRLPLTLSLSPGIDLPDRNIGSRGEGTKPDVLFGSPTASTYCLASRLFSPMAKRVASTVMKATRSEPKFQCDARSHLSLFAQGQGSR